ncbi:hypothetical protein CLCR_09347 [Cladophialophora carrionii]|uniref:Uncharacterized protein n=1 Tax=Cladophialophora carrionii TaxID=86049 RepID=A0A1C1CR08_9EURO|nr:hypothetical protein CLCR_09347 [Cladophialophora carrionii]
MKRSQKSPPHIAKDVDVVCTHQHPEKLTVFQAGEPSAHHEEQLEDMGTEDQVIEYVEKVPQRRRPAPDGTYPKQGEDERVSTEQRSATDP